MEKKSVKDIELTGKSVLMRADFNVPLDDKLNITDDTRIQAVLPTIKYILGRNAKLILMSHLGRPKGKVKDEFRLTPVAQRLSRALGRDVVKLDDCIGDDVEEKVKSMKAGDVILLENVRFHPEEEKNDKEFSKKLASLGDVFVNDAFGSCHRAHASVEGVTKYIPAVSGFLLEKEIEYFEKILKNPAKPFSLILGGAKVSDKIGVIKNMLDLVDFIFIGGAMAYTFLRSRHIWAGSSRVEEDKIEVAAKIFEEAAKKNTSIILPEDHIVADRIALDANVKYVDDIGLQNGQIGLDIGPKTVEKFKNILGSAKTIVWNGPLGYFELAPFKKGTEEIAFFLTGLDATTVIGGGDTAAAIKELGLESKVSHVSTGGGASLEYMEGKTLPGVAALQDK